MDIFRFNDSVMNAYRNYVESFINIGDDDLRSKVSDEITSGRLWPPPLIQFNPAYEYGDTTEVLIHEGVLHDDFRYIYPEWTLYRHQIEAIRTGNEGRDYVVISGTGSGKSLTYLTSIFNDLLNDRKTIGRGIQAIIVYPMNALINSQYDEIDKFRELYENRSNTEFPIRFQKYTGQEGQDVREAIKDSPPDIILTNYMMLELILTRVGDKVIKESIYKNLRFLVFDELHTYRGRQGADVAMLIRRIKAQCANQVRCIGTSATMSSGGNIIDEKYQVARVATTMFGSGFTGDQVIVEHLRKSLDGCEYSPAIIADTVKQGIKPDSNESELKVAPLANWLEDEIALIEDNGVIRRNVPLTLEDIVNHLEDYAGVDKETSNTVILDLFKWINNINAGKDNQRDAYLPYKLHQFISQTKSLYGTLEQPAADSIQFESMPYSEDEENLRLYPLAFSRLSGQQFYCVSRMGASGVLHPREFQDIDFAEIETAGEPGYLLPDKDAWNPVEDIEYLPPSWFTSTGKITKGRTPDLPVEISYDRDGRFSEDPHAHEFRGWFIPAPMIIDPTAGMIYTRKQSENTKLTRLGSEGRSTATTLLNYLVVKELKNQGFAEKDQKLISFTDNRQDAALQAGHYNDFIRTVMIRNAIYLALMNRGELDHSNIAIEVFDILNLAQEEYALNPGEFPNQINRNRDSFIDLLTFLVFNDLKRGWKMIMPNLEQTGLLRIDYSDLEDNCLDDSLWEEVPYFNALDGERRISETRTILDYFRKQFAIQSQEYLSNRSRITEKLKRIIENIKTDTWGFDEDDIDTVIEDPSWLSLGKPARRGYHVQSISIRSSLGQYLKRQMIDRGFDEVRTEDYEAIVTAILNRFVDAGWLYHETVRGRDGDEVLLYRLNITVILWMKGDGSFPVDPVRSSRFRDLEVRPNPFFQELYRETDDLFRRLKAQDHTGQVKNEDRIERENKFREGKITSLFCSPTMELGVDISNLSIVHMRNVPPNPANYVQRSGRAGRSGQPAAVYAFCSSYSPHDRNYFKKPEAMVAGKVLPPRIDLNNRELLLTHLNALYLSHQPIPDLHRSIADIINLENQDYPINEDVLKNLEPNTVSVDKVADVFHRVIDGTGQKHLNDDSIKSQLHMVANNLNRALERWRTLYRSAKILYDTSSEIIGSGRYRSNSQEIKNAKKDRYQAENQMKQLRNELDTFSLSEFYPYRYLAAEGFIPGYNFTRLPIRSFVDTAKGDYLSRPRPIALQEYGPLNIIYYNGQTYMIRQMIVPDLPSAISDLTVVKNSGYVLQRHESNLEFCPVTGSEIDSANRTVLGDCLDLHESRAMRRSRITCEEEERARQGFDVQTCFTIDQESETGKLTSRIMVGTDELMRLTFIPAARIYYINKRWNRSRSDSPGFSIDTRSGYWKNEGDAEDNEHVRWVKIFTTDTADALLLEPTEVLGLDMSGIITLQYALKRAIEDVYMVESAEIAVTLMGETEKPNIMIYESSEGSLGILSQFAENIEAFTRMIRRAYDACRYDDPEYPEHVKASYDDLLSYYNQRHHEEIDRWLIKDALTTLMETRLELGHRLFKTYDEQYNYLINNYDTDSELEAQFLQYLYSNDLKLPDGAQYSPEGIYASADFFYRPDILIFIDGSVHDAEKQREKDMETRQVLRDSGYQVLVYRYDDNLEEFVNSRKDIFSKVK